MRDAFVLSLLASAILVCGPHTLASAAEDPVALRVEHFVVPPSTGPVTHVVVQNLLDAPYEGTLSLQLPSDWQWTPESAPISLAPHETQRVPFTLEKATNLQSNIYQVRAEATGGGTTVRREQQVVCASAPYFKPDIDGNLKEWDDAIPVRLEVDGKETVVRTYWNRRMFCIAFEVEEEDRKGLAEEEVDAMQFALAPRDALTGTSPDDSAARYEFLVAGGSSRRAEGKCFALMKPGTPLSVAKETRSLSGLEFGDAEVVVKRKKGITYYECAIPFAAMPDIRPSEGREFCFSFLVHDPGGTGVRDWGETAGLWPSQRNAFAWSSWKGMKWGEQPPYDGKIEWGLCSSIH